MDGDGEHVLASDAERTRVAVWLGIAFEEGRLDLAEFDRRTRCVWAAHTQSELAVLTRDLPSVPESDLAGRLKPAPATRPGETAEAPEPGGGRGFRCGPGAWWLPGQLLGIDLANRPATTSGRSCWRVGMGVLGSVRSPRAAGLT